MARGIDKDLLAWMEIISVRFLQCGYSMMRSWRSSSLNRSQVIMKPCMEAWWSPWSQNLETWGSPCRTTYLKVPVALTDRTHDRRNQTSGPHYSRLSTRRANSAARPRKPVKTQTVTITRQGNGPPVTTTSGRCSLRVHPSFGNSERCLASRSDACNVCRCRSQVPTIACRGFTVSFALLVFYMCFEPFYPVLFNLETYIRWVQRRTRNLRHLSAAMSACLWLWFPYLALWA